MDAQQMLSGLEPIGVIRTPFTQSAGTPIQSAAAGQAMGQVELAAGYEEGLKDVEGFERVWLLYRFDRAQAARLTVTPYLDTTPRGVFATRSPARPNHIGMSCVRVVAVENNALVVAGVDMLDGTPLLDIKPYVPAFDHFEVQRVGWYEGKSADGAVADARFEIS